MEHHRHSNSRRGRVSAEGAHKMARAVGSRSRYIFFGAFERVFNKETVKWSIVPRYKRIGLIVLIALAFVWISSSIAIWCGYKFIKKYDEVSFLKVVAMPFYISEHRRNMGEYNIRQGYEAMKDKDMSKAFQCFYKGVIQSPENLEARMALAQIYFFGIRDPLYASTILNDKLALALEKKMSDYVKLSLMMFFSSPDYADNFVKLTRESLERNMLSENDIITLLTPVIKSMHNLRQDEDLSKALATATENVGNEKLSRFFASNGAVAFTTMGEFNSAWKLIKQGKIENSEIGEQIGSRIMWQNCEELKALKLIRKAAQSSRNSENAYAQLAEFYRELGFDDLANSTDDVRALLGGALYSSKLLQIENAADEKSRQKYIDEFFKTFSNSLPAITSLASYAVKSDNEELMKRCLGVDFNDKKSTSLIKLSHVEFLLRNKRIDEANEELLMARARDKESSWYVELTDGLAIAVDALSGKNVDSEIVKFFSKYSKKPTSLSNYASFLCRNGLFAQSEQLLLSASKLYPDDYRYTNLLAKIYFDNDNLGALARLAVHRRIPISILLKLKPYIYSDASIYLAPQERESLMKKIAHAEDVVAKGRLL